jgi:hypothetical protein
MVFWKKKSFILRIACPIFLATTQFSPGLGEEVPHSEPQGGDPSIGGGGELKLHRGALRMKGGVLEKNLLPSGASFIRPPPAQATTELEALLPAA